MLRKWRDDLAEEMAQLKAQIEPLDAQLRHKQEELAAVESLLALQHADPDAQAATLPSPQLTAQRATSVISDAVYELLQTERVPAHYREIHARLCERGAHVPGRNPAANLLTHIARDERFVRVGRGTYGLAEWGQTKGKQGRRQRRRRPRK
jgi:hypothetical protein